MAFYRILRMLQDSFKAINLLFILALYASLNEQVDGSRSRASRGAQVRQNYPDDQDFIRQVPLCVDPVNLVPEEDDLKRWTWVFDFYKYNTYIPVSNGITSPTGMITKFELKAIYINDTDSGYKGVLKNWLHISVESAVELEGLYVQSIGAPWGIPFGEFVTNFDCSDCDHKTSEHENDIALISCTHRAALSYEHPNVFTVGGRQAEKFDARPKIFKKMHFNFRYTQYPGVDFTYAQFLVIAVRNFNGNFSRFETFFTPTYKLDILDNVAGAFYPFYHGWRMSQIFCHEVDLSKDWTVFPGASATVKIRYSRAFDYCLRHKMNAEWSTCPPGPIQMKATDVPLSIQNWTDLRLKYSQTNGSDPQYNSSFGPDGQFCNDSGTWEWTDGEAIWPIPGEVILIYENGSLFLNETSTADKDTGIECISDAGIEDCAEFFGKEEKNCYLNRDYHKSFCSKVPRPKVKIPPPFYGKNNNGIGNYTLEDGTRGWDSLTFTEQVQVTAIHWGQNLIFGVHGKLMIFAWTVGWNVMCFSARYLKEYSAIENKSSYFGIGAWLWHHVIWTYVTIAAMLSGLYIIGNQNIGQWVDNTTSLHDLCNLHTERTEVVRCLNSTVHRYLGGTAAVLFMLGYVSGWGRPKNTTLRCLAIGYHCGMAYVGKIFYYIVMLLAYVQNFILFKTYITIIVIDFASSVMFVVATAGNCALERKFPHKDSDPTQVVPKRKYFPVPETISSFEMPNKLRKLLHFTILPIYIAVQIICFVLICFTF